MTTSAATSRSHTSSATGSTRPAVVRRLGLVCAVGSAIAVVVALLPLQALSFDNDHTPVWTALLLAVLQVPQLAGIVALHLSGAPGRRWAAWTGTVVAAAGSALLMVGELLMPSDTATSDVALSIASPAVGIGMVVVGTAVVLCRRWTSAARWLPLALGVYVFAVITPAILVGAGEVYAIAGSWLLWAVLGLALVRGGNRR
jgi:hypothetical protein